MLPKKSTWLRSSSGARVDARARREHHAGPGSVARQQVGPAVAGGDVVGVAVLGAVDDAVAARSIGSTGVRRLQSPTGTSCCSGAAVGEVRAARSPTASACRSCDRLDRAARRARPGASPSTTSELRRSRPPAARPTAPRSTVVERVLGGRAVGGADAAQVGRQPVELEGQRARVVAVDQQQLEQRCPRRTCAG